MFRVRSEVKAPDSTTFKGITTFFTYRIYTSQVSILILLAEKYGLVRRCRALVRLFLFLFLTTQGALVVILFSLVGKADSLRVARIAQRWARRLVERLNLRLEVEGTPPADGTLIVANHRSYIDVVVILSQTPCVMLAKAEIGRWPLIGWAARVGNTVFVTREDRKSRKSARESLLQIIKQRLSAVVFPEGTTSAGPGCLPFRPGMFHLACEHAIPVAPAAIEYANSEDCWVGNDTFIRHFFASFGQESLSIRVSFGPILETAHPIQLKEKAEQWVVENLRKPVNSLTDRGR